MVIYACFWGVPPPQKSLLQRAGEGKHHEAMQPPDADLLNVEHAALHLGGFADTEGGSCSSLQTPRFGSISWSKPDIPPASSAFHDTDGDETGRSLLAWITCIRGA